MRTARELLEALERLSTEELDLPLVVVHSSSGAAHEVSSVGSQTKGSWHDSGPLCELKHGTKFLQVAVTG